MKLIPATVLRLVLAVLVGGSAVGCRLTENAWRTTISEPADYPRNIYDRLSRARFRSLAEDAFAEARANARAELDNYGVEPFSVDHACGFVDGFVDYLEGGGTGEPPPLPPRRYWTASYQTTCGVTGALDWFRGYAHGASVAQGSGYRELVTVPVSDFLQSETAPYQTMPAALAHPRRGFSVETEGGAARDATSSRENSVLRLPPVMESSR